MHLLKGIPVRLGVNRNGVKYHRLSIDQRVRADATGKLCLSHPVAIPYRLIWQYEKAMKHLYDSMHTALGEDSHPLANIN